MNLEELKEKAKKLLAIIPNKKWNYDDGITDNSNPNDIERGKCPCVETEVRGDPGTKHTLICDPYDCNGLETMDLIGNYIAAVSPSVVLKLIERLKTLEANYKDDMQAEWDKGYDKGYDQGRHDAVMLG